MKALILPIVFGALILAKSAMYIVDEGKQAIITQFGKPIGKPVTNAGLHFKTPFIHDIRFVDKRILSWDGIPNEIPTKDKKFIKVDTTARWRIVDALKFIETVQSERGAKARLDTILDSATRDVISNHRLVEAVRNSNSVLNKVNAQKEGDESEVYGEIEKIDVGREKLQLMIAASAEQELMGFGIKLIDVQLRRISYSKTVEEKVYDRMISERQRVAQKIRSFGQGERAKIEGRLQRDLRKIQSEGYKKSEIIRGKGEAKAIKIYADALSRDPKFYEFIKTMESYKKTLGKKAQFIISTQGSEYLKYLKSQR